jgi:hypothetical protein
MDSGGREFIKNLFLSDAVGRLYRLRSYIFSRNAETIAESRTASYTIHRSERDNRNVEGDLAFKDYRK